MNPKILALVGQPNCGKSTLFNAVAGFKVNTGNFSGTTVSYTETTVQWDRQSFRLIDLPGTYSISSLDLSEKVTRDYLLSGKIDVLINVVDTTMLSRSLELTLQLVEMKIPMVVALNMSDETQSKGITIDLARFQELTGIKPIPITAVLGVGIDELFHEALNLKDYNPILPIYDRDVETVLSELLQVYPSSLKQAVPTQERFLTLRLLEKDLDFEQRVEQSAPDFLSLAQTRRKELAEMHNWPESSVLSSHRHAYVLDLYEQIATHSHSRKRFADNLERFLAHPFGALTTILFSLLLLFSSAWKLGDWISSFTVDPLQSLNNQALSLSPTILAVIASGVVQGLQAGLGIVLPYLIPLLLLLSIYEDTGLLPRIAFLMDGLLHHFGLHGKSIIPLVLGYGCTVPALMSCRNLENERDRSICMLIIPFISCSARSVVILALVGKYLGVWFTLLIYLGNILLVLLLSKILSRFQVNLDMGLIMDVPPLRRPFWRIIFKKLWLRLYDFLVFAWPIIAISSVVFAYFSVLGVDRFINSFLSPITSQLLKLPPEVGMALFLGIFRKELALLMLSTALGTTHIGDLLSPMQILVLVVFTVLYIPCVASLATLGKEGGWKRLAYSTALSLLVSLLVAGALAQLLVHP